MTCITRRQRGSSIILLALLSAGTLALSACGSSTGSSPASEAGTAASTPSATPSTSVAPTPEVAPSASAETSEASSSAATLTETQVAKMLLTTEDLALAGKQPKGRFEDTLTQVQPGPSAYTSLVVTPAECTEFAEGPFGGVSPSPDGPITWSAQRILQEGQPSTYLNTPVNVIQTLDIFQSAAEAQTAFARIAAIASSCFSYSYEDDQGAIEQDWVDVLSTTPEENPQRPPFLQNSVYMINKIGTRFISVDGNALMGLSVLSGNALDNSEVERFGDVAALARDRVKAGLG
jgi:hypothetical protein